MRRCISGAGAALLLALAAQPAAAYQSGGVPLADVLEIAKPYPNLVLQVRLQLVRANLKREQVTCVSERLAGEWTRLAGQRLAPYQCAIGRRSLAISATQTYLDASGRRLKPDDPETRRKAVKVTEKNLKWSWK